MSIVYFRARNEQTALCGGRVTVSVCVKKDQWGLLVFNGTEQRKHSPVDQPVPVSPLIINVPSKESDFTGRTQLTLRKTTNDPASPRVFDMRITGVCEHEAGCAHLKEIKITDMGQQLDAEERLRLYSMVFDNTSDAIMITDARNNIISVNRAFTEITGYTAEDVLGKNPRLLSSGQQGPEFYQELWHSVKEKGEWQGEIWNRRKNGELYGEWLTISMVRDQHGAISNYVAIFSDITLHKLKADRNEYLAHHDALTGLGNRLLLTDRIKAALQQAQRTNKLAAIFYIDLDHFKEINDTLGHHSGDAVLRETAKRLMGGVRGVDSVLRLGGDEFLLIQNIREHDDAVQVARKIIRALSRPLLVGRHQLTLKCSIGICISTDVEAEPHLLVHKADQAMYRAKHRGGSSYQFYSDEEAGMAAPKKPATKKSKQAAVKR